MPDGFPFPLTKLIGAVRGKVRRFDPELDSAATEPFPTTGTDIELPVERDIELPAPRRIDYNRLPEFFDLAPGAKGTSFSRDEQSAPASPAPSPRDAIDVLRARFGGFDPTYVPVDEESGYGDSTGSLALHARRAKRRDELADRLPAEDAATVLQTEGYVQGEPGRRRRSNASAVMSDILTRGRLNRLDEQMAADPFTGDAEQARVGKVQDTLMDAATTRRPELTDASNAVASRNAFAQFLQRRAGFDALNSPEGQQALDAASRRRIAENEALGRARGAGRGQPIVKDTPTGLMAIDRETGVATPVTDDQGNVVRGHGLSQTQQAKANDTQAAIDLLEGLKVDFPAVQGRFQGVGPVSSKISDFRNAFPLIPSDKDWARFSNNTQTLVNQTVKAITGAQMSEPEAQRIKAQLPTADLKPDVWLERYNATLKNLRGTMRRLELLAQGMLPSELDKVRTDLLAEDGGGGEPSEQDLTNPDWDGR